MAFSDGLSGLPTNAVTLSLSFAVLYLLFTFASAVHVYFGPLSKFPGPKYRAFSRIPRILCMIRGDEATVIPELHRRYGPVVRIAPNELSFRGDAQAFKDIHGFKKAGQNHVFKDKFFYGKPFNGVDSLITADDANHSRQRKLVAHAFADKSLKDLEPMLKTWSGTMQRKLAEQAGKPVDMLKYYNCTTFDIMGDLSFNEGLNMLEDGEYSSWVQAIFLGIKNTSQLRALKMSSSFGKYIVDKWFFQSQFFRRKQAEHWNYSKDRVDRRLKMSPPERPDLWSKILEKASGPDGLTIEEHRSLASLFMIAGTETTATALSGVTYYLLRNPQYMKKLTTEIREAHASYDDITLESIQKLKYLHAVLQEGLRMYPPVPSTLSRMTPSGGVTICGQFVPENTSLGIHHLSTYRSEDNFKNPYKFAPERFLGDPEYANDNLSALEPFSTGPRNCVGKNLAWHEMRLLLCTTLLHFDLELCEESSNWPDQKIHILWEKKPLWCKLTEMKT
ncbi:Cytochrome P450 monooxygenase lcsI [Fulvia fulva]|uniref:Cytochrome P450 monooxygenase lcsI n=1 Tax=Passalora fulva TaxID=5499 RepID=A0A9Q8L7P0_PASFU|nr:Cytochrome P450 monooxygenase lcsI [Fulvia fulva]KAK4635985.1 Cytochrome P450 monooxygenase lcsI [Fulvia fulva]KAK4636754.1 Cytochrome P450 monooxygenase lcsI [Fulvia fulva]UJO12234.1 Cytochrome P450 monooxygenase lcsI [Fulvia fulva]WPV08554.1 Cytochrome P450 monooxygenase lcsI [Fulvia fulva]WPV24665.1 Cytochrome P450 monooxygenase lcsI [Fulvia fulva]